jgi:P-type Cu+ transporter
MATDPVCGMYVAESPDALQLVRENRTYYFCATECLRQFAEPDQELRRLRQKLTVAWPLAIAVVLLTYIVRPPGAVWVALLLASVVEFYPGWQFFTGARDALRSRTWNMDVLIAIGTGAAYGYSVVALALPARVPAASFFDASSLIVALILSGNYLEHLTREKARGSLRGLKDLLPETARRVVQGTEADVPVEDLAVGDRVRVLPGGRIPVDGVILEGTSSVNESLVTGESLPVTKRAGDTLIAGSVNGEGRLEVRTTRVGEDTVLAQIGQLVSEAETSRVPLQELADRIARAFVPVVLGLAILATVFWGIEGVGSAVAVLVLVSVVITACPCAFSIATPAAIVVGTGRAAELGILFRGKDALERASTIDLVLTDKTGTLTRGRPTLTDVVPAGAERADEVLRLAAAVEEGSEHPLARAVLDAARSRHLAWPSATSVRARPGTGVEGRVAADRISVDNLPPRDSAEGVASTLAVALAALESQGKAWSIVRKGDFPIGLLGFADDLSPEVPAAIAALRADRIPVVLVTGDHRAAADVVGRRVGVSEVHASVSPAEKVALVRRYQASGRRVAFVGDGINDAPALAAADLGIAVGAATAFAAETSGVVLLRTDFRGVPLALRIGRRTVRKVRGNLTWALGYNAVLLPVAMGALVPWLGLGVFLVLPVTGAVAMALSSTSVVLNSLSLHWVRLGERRPERAIGSPTTR